ncbi:chloride channel, other eukaryote [Exophiala aquamarina CBS 119918]|uniref:Chloride channel protein n=1 Tax=Exophiala aquamarina CBS 119918 TaxID=1182545 RepID=A0A072P298_9EURO|nr:chloride channel, other eukaryote [Exophiala aquamarina CBS 119918]KEF53403.1 chloride channel, other eukaryote [Exophiala aquamarina CBS 119918]
MTSRIPPSASASARPSLSARRLSRRLSTVSSIEYGDNVPPVNPTEQTITEEIAEIKRYEDFTTIDWVQDAAQEQLRRRARRRESRFFDRDGVLGWRRKIWEAYDAAQAWIVITLVGIVIGLNAAAVNIVTEWLSDVKLGYCTTAWYLNEDFCCYGSESGCDEWKRWTSFTVANYFIYAIFALLLAFVSAFLVKSYAPYAAGSGISEIKCIIAGFIMKGFLGFWTFLIKSICLPLAIASGLSVGKEGPSVHYAVCVGNVISRFFSKYKKSASKTREILTATAGAGVAVAFGSPIGGVLFSLEEMASHFPLKTLWRSYFCALVATAVLSAVNPFRTGQLVMFSVKYDRDWHFFEIVFYIILGVFGGLYGAFVIKYNLMAQSFRKKYLSKYAIPEAVFLAGATALLCYPNMFLRIDMTEMMGMLFRECEGDNDYNGLCEAQNRWSLVGSLLIATLLRVFLVIISYGCKVPAGIFVPSMAIGASFGRMLGIIVQWLYERFPESQFFASCQPDVPCITPGTYAFLGAGAALSGIMHLTISVTVIMFELTGALTYILPTMIVVGVTKATGDRFSNAGIADRMIWFNGFPFLDNKEEHSFVVPVSQVMTSQLTVLPATGMEVKAVHKLLNDTDYSGFPIVEDTDSKILVGYIGRTELQYAIDRAKKQGMLASDAKCRFLSEREDEAETAAPLSPAVTFDSMAIQTADFSSLVDCTPISVHPRLPLETAMELFKKMGPRVILVDHHGRLEGLVTVKDCLKYQFKVEAQEHQATALREDNGNHERIVDILRRLGDVFADKLNNLSRGRLKLGSRLSHGGWSRVAAGDGQEDFADDYNNEHEILDGTEDITEQGVEMDTR